LFDWPDLLLYSEKYLIGGLQIQSLLVMPLMLVALIWGFAFNQMLLVMPDEVVLLRVLS